MKGLLCSYLDSCQSCCKHSTVSLDSCILGNTFHQLSLRAYFVTLVQPLVRLIWRCLCAFQPINAVLGLCTLTLPYKRVEAASESVRQRLEGLVLLLEVSNSGCRCFRICKVLDREGRVTDGCELGQITLEYFRLQPPTCKHL